MYSSVRVELDPAQLIAANRGGFLDCRRSSVQSGQRVWPSVATLGQFPTEAEFLALLAFTGGSYSPELAPLLVCQIGLRSVDGAFAFDGNGPSFGACLVTLRRRDLVLPALAGMARTKTCRSVLPIERVCGQLRQTL